MLTSDPPVTEEERRKKSLYYESCTSPFKDDFYTLVKCLKSDQGTPHTRQEAGFLLWHHALQGGPSTGSLLSAGLPAACVGCLDSSELGGPDRGCCAGILLALASSDRPEAAEAVLRCRGPASGRPLVELLTAQLGGREAAAARLACARLLLALAKQAPQPVLRTIMDGSGSGGISCSGASSSNVAVGGTGSISISANSASSSSPLVSMYLPSYFAVWDVTDPRDAQRDAQVVTAITRMVTVLVQERPDFASALVCAGGVRLLLGLLRVHRSEAVCGAAAACLAALLAGGAEGAAEQLEQQDGVPLLVDLLGPPPSEALKASPGAATEDPAATAAGAAAAGAAAGSNQAATSAAAGATSAQRAGPPNRKTSNGGAVNGRSGTAVSVSSAAAAGTSTGKGGKSGGGGGGSGGGAGGSGGGAAGADAALTSTGQLPKARLAKSTGNGGSEGADAYGSPGGSDGAEGSPSAYPPLARVPLPIEIPGLHHTSAAAAAALLSGNAPSAALLSPSGLPADPSLASWRSDAATCVGEKDDCGGGEGGGGGGGGSHIGSPHPPQQQQQQQAPSHPADLGTNHSGVRWLTLPGLHVAAAAAACLGALVTRPVCLEETDRRLATQRLLAQVRSAVPQARRTGGGTGGGAASSGGGAAAGGSSSSGGGAAAAAASSPSGKKAKKKSLALAPETVAGLSKVLGLLKFLSLTNLNRYRIARMGAVPTLVQLYGEAPDYSLRNHSQAILSNVALLAENGQALKDGGAPEEFLVSNPMRLTEPERALLRQEFPGEPALGG